MAHRFSERNTHTHTPKKKILWIYKVLSHIAKRDVLTEDNGILMFASGQKSKSTEIFATSFLIYICHIEVE